jgi:perosamine synthetase
LFGAPQPRFRIYTQPSSYLRVLGELLTWPASDNSAVERLETEIGRRTGMKYAVCTPTARTAIYLTLKSLIKPGQRVLLSPLTIVDVINMVICAGGVPTFVDLEKNTCNMDAAEVERQITRDTGAVLVTHLHGLACDIERIRAIGEKNGVPLVEDAAQAFSSQVGGRWVGTFGRAGIFSFGLYKIVNAFFGGMVVTNEESLYRQLKDQMNSFPLMKRSALLHRVLFGLATDVSTLPLPFSLFTYWFFRFGYMHSVDAILDMVTVDRHPLRKSSIPSSLLCRMWPSQANLIKDRLDGVEAHNADRLRAAQRYDAGLRDLPQLILPPLRKDGSHIYTYYAVRCPDRHALMRFGLTRGRDWVLSHYHNCASLEIFKDFYASCPIAEATAKELLYLPTYPRYSPEEVDRNIKVIREFFNRP